MHLSDELMDGIKGVSYIGAPHSYTAVYVAEKVKNLIENLYSVEHCLVFTQTGIQIPETLIKKHIFFFTDNPQLAYTKFAKKISEMRFMQECKLRYIEKNGSFISETATIGENVYIEPGCMIGHHVEIENNTMILAGAVVKNAFIGEHTVIGERSVIGSWGFTITEDEDGNKCRIPSLGRVIIGHHVEIGEGSVVSCGSAGDTILNNYVKTGAFVHIAHDACLEDNVEIAAGSIIGGFVNIQKNCFLGINVSIKNRVMIEENAYIGIGSVVTKTVKKGRKVFGNPAKRIDLYN